MREAEMRQRENGDGLHDRARPRGMRPSPDRIRAWGRLRTPLGEMRVGATVHGLAAVDFTSRRPSSGRPSSASVRRVRGESIRASTEGPERADLAVARAHLGSALRQLREYFDGGRRDFDLPLDLDGTEFDRRVWRQLGRIPCGGTRSYAEIARSIGKPGAARAAGGAIGRNPVSIIVPCHRVIGANGSLTGFGGGLSRKRWLLDHESGAGRLPIATARRRPISSMRSR